MKKLIDWLRHRPGVKDLEGTNTELHTGIYLPALNPKELKQAINYARDNGAKGAAFLMEALLHQKNWKLSNR